MFFRRLPKIAGSVPEPTRNKAANDKGKYVDDSQEEHDLVATLFQEVRVPHHDKGRYVEDEVDKTS